MSAPVSAVRYLKYQLVLSLLFIILCLQQRTPQQKQKANPQRTLRSNAPPKLGKGNRKNRQNSQVSSSSAEPIEPLSDQDALSTEQNPLIGPNAARALDSKKPQDPEKKDKESLNIKIHLDLHAKVRLDLEADIYGDIVIGLL